MISALFAMAGLCLRVCITLLVMSIVRGREMTELLLERMDSIEDDLINVEKQVNNRIDIAKHSVTTVLKQHIKQHVRQAMAELLEGESIEDMVRSQIVSEVRQLRQGNHQMKRQLHHMQKSLRNVQGEVKTYKEALQRAETEASDLKTCTKHIANLQICERDLEQSNRDMGKNDDKIQKLNQNFKLLNETFQKYLPEVKPTSKTEVALGLTPTSQDTITWTSVATTAYPEEEKSRILIVPAFSSRQQGFQQLNIHRNSITNYSLQSLKDVTSVAFISRLKKLLIGVRNPDKILAAQLDNYNVTTVREPVRTYGMAVDEDRELVFMTTRNSFSRMSTHDKNVTVITDISRFAYSITVNTKAKTIYACMYNNVIVVSYDGRILQTLATGSSMYAVTLDTTGGNLYYNDDKKVMKLSLSNNVTTELVVLSVEPFDLVYYRNTVYFSSTGFFTGTIGAVDVGQDVIEYKLQNISMKTQTYMICLVP